jgi:hypothetical protein
MMNVFSKRNLLVGIATLLIGIGASAAIWGVPKFLKRKTAIKGQVNSYLLDDRGAVNGLLLSTGDQLHFSPETGVAAAAQIKIGDEVSAIGHAGTQSKYGREVRVEQISANGRTIIEIPAGPPRPNDHHGPTERHEFDERHGAPMAPATNDAGSNPQPGGPTGATTAASPPAPTPELFEAMGSVQTHLVNGHGDVDGLILTSGEQMRFSPRVGQLVLGAEQNGGTQVSVEGPGVRNERGVVIRPSSLSIGTQTITLGR